MWQHKTQKSSFGDSIKALEADIRHANSLAAALPRGSGQGCFQMKVSYSPFAALLLFLIDWMDCSSLDSLPSCLGLFHILVYKVYVDDMPKISSQERRASLREFYGLCSFISSTIHILLDYPSNPSPEMLIDPNTHLEIVPAVIYPSLKQLEGALRELMEKRHKRDQCPDILSDEGLEATESTHKGPERGDECGICMETGSQVVLPNCGHSMCISCYQDWLARSPSCPFCRGSLKRVSSGDLWILMGSRDVVDTITLAKENLRQFYLYMEKLPLLVTVPDNNYLSFDYMI